MLSFDDIFNQTNLCSYGVGVLDMKLALQFANASYLLRRTSYNEVQRAPRDEDEP